MTTRRTDTDAKVDAAMQAARIIAGLTQREAADRAGVTYQQIAKYEGGTNRTPISQFVRLAAIYGRDPGDLLAEIAGRGAASAPLCPRRLALVKHLARLRPRSLAILSKLAEALDTQENRP